MDRELLDFIDKMQGSPVLVLGDMIADVYLHGDISRISREAPVLVLLQKKERVVAGGAANVVNNAATMGGKVYAAGILGQDRTAQGLIDCLAEKGVDTEGLICDSNRPTISKTRVIGGGRTTVSQQIVRIDREWNTPIDKKYHDMLGEYLKVTLPKVKGVVLSDYGSGTISRELQEMVIDYCRKHDIPTIVDSRYDILRFKSVDYIKQNDAEISSALEKHIENEAEIVAGGHELVAKMEAKGALITRGEDGMSLVESTGSVTHIPVSDLSEVYDVSGAGDTCVAAFILGVAAGVAPAKAAEISNIAAGIAVRKLGTATVSVKELQEFIKERI